MANTSEISEPVTIEDDDDDVQILEVINETQGNDSSLVGDKGDVQTQGRTRTCRTLYPVEVNGYTKPSYNYCRLITQALATAPLRRASGLQICESIAKKHPYYAHLTYPDWRTSIYSALRNRKKFFTLIGSNENNELVWTFNPKFEQYMLEKWVPKYVKEKDQSLSSTICMPWLPKNHPDQPHNAVTRHEPSTSQLSSTSMSEDIGTQVPVIMFSGTLTSSQPASPKIIDCDVLCDEPNLIANENLEKDPLQADNSNPSSPVIQNVCTVTDDFRPWEPEVTVNEDNQRNRTEQNGTQKPNSPSAPIRGATPQKSSRNFTTDYALLSLDEQPTIQKDETVYRANLHKDDTQQNRTQQNETQKSNLPGAVPTGGASPQRSARHTTGDFTLSNLSEKHVIQKDEIFYRVNFNKEHKSIEKFRLHCTVCDEHLGTSSVACRRKVRFHSVLGVLVCTTCYDKTYRAPADTCLWCAKAMMNSVKTCSKCRKLFCERCMQRNFGPVFASKLLENTTLWVCFVCDIKQLWPHRAIAYFLFRHYRYMKRKKYELSKCQPSVQGQADIFTEDLTSCCKGRTIGPNPISNPPLLSTVVAEASTSNNLIPPMIPNSSAMAIASQPSLFLIGDQSSNYIYVQAPNNLPSVTLNTGTQYIHNVFTDRPALPNTITYPLPSEQPVLSPQYQINNPNPLPNCHPSPYSTVTTIPTPHQESSPTTQSNTFPVNPGESILLKAVDNFRPIIMTSSDILGEEAPMLIPDIDIQEENVVASPLMSARERIEQKPMPKSKKQSLLRTVLMSESIESMKRNLQLSSETDPLSVNGNVNTPVTVPSTISNECEQNIEEPILKSIIETATERLINIQNNQNSSNANKNTSQQNRFDNAPVDATIDLCEDEDPLAIPKIKIKTLKELQDPEMFRGFENEESGSAITKLSPETDKPSDKVDIDITDLKQGIIETSRSLIGTQKKFKELAKIISSNLLYKPDQAAELITQFHDILKTCYAELDQIDKNVRQKFGHLTSGNAIASILQSVRKPEEVANPVVQKKKRGRKRKLKHKPNVVVTQPIVEQNVDGSIEDFEEPQNHPRTGNKVTNNTNVESSDMLPSHSKRKRDLLVFNPLGKVILGSPEITEEDLRMIPDSSDLTDTKQSKPLHNEVYLEEIRRRQYLAQKMAWRKKNIWLSSKRKKNKHKKRSLHITNSPLAYNEEGSLVKKSKKRRKKMFDSDNEDTFYKPTNNQYPKRIRRPSGLSPPLRVSGRKHPSTLLAQLNTASVLKPCSVVIEKLDSKFVELMVRRGKKSNISYEPVFKYINYESDSSNTSST
ncbi:uncharacterized protein LOC128989660 isoform X2 [Macrosteles quadrilineatus]|uniref:uncharacterized protein LOC128989660 isoform X2 n=1 Tax=Macrosteles quadrilineatus TaxID=74068 RepID=UPI0023E1C52B|nr:uncharacterized protein LOC128989660 isoform X2 [Macrosteles quadrilineatus]